MMTIQQLIDEKNRSGLTYEQISIMSGVPLGTVQKVLGRITASPRYDTLVALERVLGQQAPPNCVMESPTPYYNGNNALDGSKDSVGAGKVQGEYTIEDYYALPDDQRFELIDGVLYVMEAPTTIHQMMAGDVYHQVKNYISSKKGKCIPLMSPCDVQLDMDDKTMVQPDFMIICDRSKVVKQKIYGAPDFILEVLSTSTRKKDMSLKLAKYENAGVREYWLIDPDKQKVIVYTFDEDDSDVSIYDFHDKVPVHIYDGKCVVDFEEIWENIEFLL